MRQWLLAQLYLDIDDMSTEDGAKALAAVLRRSSFGTAMSQSLPDRELIRAVVSMRKHRQSVQLPRSRITVNSSWKPLLLFADSWLGRLPLEACPCLARRQVVRGIAPNIALRAWAATKTPRSSGGYYVVDPSGVSSVTHQSSSGVGSNVVSLLGEWADNMADSRDRWTGHVGGPGPNSAEVVQQLAVHSNFLYIGHGECAKRLLQSELLERGASGAHASLSPPAAESVSMRVPLQSVVALMGCSTAKLIGPPVASAMLPQWCSSEEFEDFGLPFSLLIGGTPAVLGAARGVLAGEVDRLTCELLRIWARGRKTTSHCSLLAALFEARAANTCMLPNLTGASLVCYGIPV